MCGGGRRMLEDVGLEGTAAQKPLSRTLQPPTKNRSAHTCSNFRDCGVRAGAEGVTAVGSNRGVPAERLQRSQACTEGNFRQDGDLG